MPEQEQAAAVQPDQGQGADVNGGGLYDLASAPDELRPYLEAELKKIEGNTTRKFQEHAQAREKWAPLEELGVHDVPADELQELLNFRSIAQDPEQFRGWWEQMGEQLGYFEPDGESDAPGEQQPQQDDLMEQFRAMLDERLSPFEQKFHSEEQERAVNTEREAISAELAGLREQHGEFDEQLVCQLALAYADDDDAIAKGFADYQRVTSGAQRELVADKSGQPDAVLSGGQPPSQAETIDSFDAASRAARERFRAG